MVEYIMKKEICGIFHAKCGTQDLTEIFGTVPRKAGRVVTLYTVIRNYSAILHNLVHKASEIKLRNE
jgi:hypothetical protein